MSERARSIFVRLNKAEAAKVRALAREHGVSAEEVIRRMVVTFLEELEAEANPAEEWRPEF